MAFQIFVSHRDQQCQEDVRHVTLEDITPDAKFSLWGSVEKSVISVTP